MMRQWRHLMLSLACVALAFPAVACRPQDRETRDTRLATDRDADIRDDGWITTKIQAQLFMERDVQGDIDVTTSDGVVTLSGTAETEEARQRAVHIARQIDGVVDVRDELLVGDEAVATGGERERPREDPRAEERKEPGEAVGGRLSSVWMTTKIQAKYFTDDQVRAREIDVTTVNGVVTLAGTVDTEQTRQRAVQIAQDTEGVVRVEDRLRIVPDREPAEPERAEPEPRPEETDPEADREEWFADERITMRIQAKFYTDPQIRGRRIDVSTSDGVVTLSGQVRTEYERGHAVAVAERTEGVRDVRDHLTVRDAAEEPEREDERPVTERVDDGWITTRIQAKYFVNPDLRARDIAVETSDGVVTLTGEVRSEAERQEAIEVARDTGGVVRVVDRLEMRPDDQPDRNRDQLPRN